MRDRAASRRILAWMKVPSPMLQDHFNPPLSALRDWHAFHNAWATTIAYDLNTRLPKGYFAEPNVQFGIEIDVAAFEDRQGTDAPLAVSERWSAPAPTLTIPLPLLSDRVEVLVYNREAGPVLAAAIELVSPSNKDRPTQRDAFVSKCASYLQQAVGLAIVDLVTIRHARLHDDLLARLGAPERPAPTSGLYAVSYRPVERDDEPNLDVWYQPLTIGRPLPTLPLWMNGRFDLPLDLDLTYRRTCRELRLATPET